MFHIVWFVGFLIANNYCAEFLEANLGRIIPVHNPQFTSRNHKSKLIALEIKFVLTVVNFWGFNFFSIWFFAIRQKNSPVENIDWLGFFSVKIFLHTLTRLTLEITLNTIRSPIDTKSDTKKWILWEILQMAGVFAWCFIKLRFSSKFLSFPWDGGITFDTFSKYTNALFV